MPSRWPLVERAKPLLGTIVSIRAACDDLDDAREAVDRAFADIARLHHLMSFHETESDLSRLNRDAATRPVRVDPDVFAVLAEAVRQARASNGAFDPTVAGVLAQAGALPSPPDAPPLDPAGSWRDIELTPSDSAVRLRRTVWLDLGGVAKGYAVDAACARLRGLGVRQGCINAGGDLRIFGPGPERVRLSPGLTSAEGDAVLEVQDASLASSGRAAAGPRDGVDWSLHVDGVRRSLIPRGRFVSVVAKSCMVADALTKVVLAADAQLAQERLRAEGAVAYVHAEPAGWSVWGEVT